jgi:hypothetical protein
MVHIIIQIIVIFVMIHVSSALTVLIKILALLVKTYLNYKKVNVKNLVILDSVSFKIFQISASNVLKIALIALVIRQINARFAKITFTF